MLVASNTIQPLRLGSGSPATAGWLYLCKRADGGMLEAFRDARFSVSAPNPARLNSAGELPYPLYIRETEAWGLLYENMEGRAVFIRSYPLQPVEGNASEVSLKGVISLQVRVKADVDKISASSIQSDSIEASGTISSDYASVAKIQNLVTASLSIGGFKIPAAKDFIASPVLRADKTTPAEWDKWYPLGCYLAGYAPPRQGYDSFISPPNGYIVKVFIEADGSPLMYNPSDAAETHFRARSCGRLDGRWDFTNTMDRGVVRSLLQRIE